MSQRACFGSACAQVRADYKTVARALTRKGNALARLQRYEDAVAAYQKALTEHRCPVPLPGAWPPRALRRSALPGAWPPAGVLFLSWCVAWSRQVHGTIGSFAVACRC